MWWMVHHVEAHQAPHRSPNVLQSSRCDFSRSSSCHWLTVAYDSEGHIKPLLRLCHPSSSLSLLHLSGPPAAELQLEVSGNLLTQAAIWPFLTAAMWDSAEELRRNCRTSSIRHKRQGLQANFQATGNIQLISTEPLTSYFKEATRFLPTCSNW